MEKAVVLLSWDEPWKKRAEELAAGRCELVFPPAGLSGEELAALTADASAILGDADGEVLSRCRCLRFLQSLRAGTDAYVKGGFPAGAALCSMRGAYGVRLAEYEMAAILSLCKGLPWYAEQQRLAVWGNSRPDRTLEGGTALIVGAGNIGTELAKRLRPFVERIVGVRRSARSCPPEYDRMISLEELDDWLGEADVVACSLPSTADTKGLFDADRIGRMKRDAVFVNVGRGDAVDLNALCAALDAGRLWGAAVDVTDPEPLEPEHPAWRTPNLIVTPHVAGGRYFTDAHTQRRIRETVLENFRRWLEGEELLNRVDFHRGY